MKQMCVFFQVEPFFVTLALYDASAGKKISADLHLDLNHPLVSHQLKL